MGNFGICYTRTFYQLGTHEAGTRLVLRLPYVFASVCLCVCVFVCNYHVH